MGRSPCCSKEEVNRGAWTAQEDNILTQYIKTHGEIGWRSIPKKAGLNRCGKSCRLRWLNYLRPDIKRGNISPDEEELIIRMHRLLGNRWSLIAGRLPGRTDNEIKNYWNTHLSKQFATNDPNSKSHIPERTSSWPQLANLCNGVEEAGPSRCSSEDNEFLHSVESYEIRSGPNKEVSSSCFLSATKSSEELDVSKSWTQFLEDSLMADIAEDPLIDLNNGSILSPLEALSQTDPPNFSCSTSSSDLAQHNSLPSDMQLPCIDFGMIHDFSVENLLQPEAYYLEALCPNQCCDNVDHAHCFVMAAEQGMAEIYNNTLQQPHSIQQEQHPQQCEAQKPSQMELDELDELFHCEEPRESHVQSSLTTTHHEEEYRDSS